MRVVIHFKLIRDAILKAGLSETEWAKRYGFSQRAVNSWVKEERAPRFKNILKLAQALDCSVSDICPNLPCEEFREAVIKTGDHSMLQAAYENKTYPKEFLDQVSQEMNIKITVNEQGANMTKLAFYRRKAGLTQESLGEKLGVSNKTISKWETGKCLPDVEMMMKLSRALGVSISELYECIENAKDGTKEDYNEERIWQYKKYSIVSCFLILLSLVFLLFLTENWSRFDNIEDILRFILIMFSIASFTLGIFFQLAQFIRLYSYSKNKYYREEYVKVMKKYGIIFLVCLSAVLIIPLIVIVIANVVDFLN